MSRDLVPPRDATPPDGNRPSVYVTPPINQVVNDARAAIAKQVNFYMGLPPGSMGEKDAKALQALISTLGAAIKLGKEVDEDGLDKLNDAEVLAEMERALGADLRVLRAKLDQAEDERDTWKLRALAAEAEIKVWKSNSGPG